MVFPKVSWYPVSFVPLCAAGEFVGTAFHECWSIGSIFYSVPDILIHFSDVAQYRSCYTKEGHAIVPTLLAKLSYSSRGVVDKSLHSQGAENSARLLTILSE